jgi:methylated-DNA-[protein]-cysteine S-methyltransferase
VTTAIAVFETAIGPCGIAWGDAGIRGVQLPEASEQLTVSRLLRRHLDGETTTPPPEIQDAIDRITALLAGAADTLRDVDVDLDGVTEFDRRVYDVARGVGPGETTTYGEIATQLGSPRASREVGQALGHNPVPLIVPCHRVLAAGGKLGGFSAHGGVTTKLRLLSIESAAPNGQTALYYVN